MTNQMNGWISDYPCFFQDTATRLSFPVSGHSVFVCYGLVSWASRCFSFGIRYPDFYDTCLFGAMHNGEQWCRMQDRRASWATTDMLVEGRHEPIRQSWQRSRETWIAIFSTKFNTLSKKMKMTSTDMHIWRELVRRTIEIAQFLLLNPTPTQLPTPFLWSDVNFFRWAISRVCVGFFFFFCRPFSSFQLIFPRFF